MSAFLDPIPATSRITNDPIMLLAAEVIDGSFVFLAMFPDGVLTTIGTDDVNADFRYDFRSGKWVNVSWGAEDDETDSEDDWGESVPGYVPNPDGAGDGDQGDEADHDPRDMDTDEGRSE